jgi:uroporphyrinogen decarboxylase
MRPASPSYFQEGLQKMNKRDLVLSLLDQNQLPPYPPAAFFLHFGQGFQRGQPAIDRHLEYFRFTGMDILKIQYERPYPPIPAIQRPGDWSLIPRYGKEFFDAPLQVVKGLVEAAKKEALVIVTLYSPFMLAGHTVEKEARDIHMQENPQAVKPGMEAITDSVLIFVRECIRLGVDGFYASTQGGESQRFADKAIFDECVRPYDLAVMEEINRKCIFNVLHICDYHLSYADLSPFVDYPGHVVNCNLNLYSGKVSAREVARLFNRPFMGGLDRLGVLATGDSAAIKREVGEVLQDAPERFFLAADCTVPAETPWENLRQAVGLAHAYRR